MPRPGSGALHALALDCDSWPANADAQATRQRCALADGVSSVRWCMASEVRGAVDVAALAAQAERGLQSVQLVPRAQAPPVCPSHAMLSWLPFGALEARRLRTSSHIVRTYFLPLLSGLVRAMASGAMRGRDFAMLRRTVCNLHAYFQRYSWEQTWGHPAVFECWCEEVRHR